ncbi:MAG: phosphoribosylformylglycinamidine synthase subunit PurS [Spirochaetes bacterium]|nr:phosphoribosylformylglycinamidine synthase subunit PurS [Spirochaetota bacterium]
MYLAKINVTLKDSILDPQGETIKEALIKLGFNSESVRIGKYIEIKLEAKDEKEATEKVDQMCRKLLYNPEIEKYSFIIEKI